MDIANSKDFRNHPCFNAEAKGKFGRIHLPVAPQCNIKCNFCDRKYDCVNESRPGVTSTLLSPPQALLYLQRVLEKEPRISVVGIAGPGDPFANGEETMTTLRLISERYPQMLLCVSSNGMAIAPYIEELASMAVSHVTITVCAVDAAIGARIYGWVTDGKVVYHGRQGAELLLSRQLAAIALLKRHGMVVKVNCIVIPGINDHHVEEVAKTMKALGVDLFNCMAMFPNAGSPFGHLEQPSKEMMEELRSTAEVHLPQMRHCTRCRADAVGLLGEDRTTEFRSCLNACAKVDAAAKELRPYVAVASEEGILINRHLGEARRLEIWEKHGDGYRKVAERATPEAGGGGKRWHQLARILGDCRAVLAAAIGPTPAEILDKSGIKPVEAGGFIEEGLALVYDNRDASVLRTRSQRGGGGCCGSGGGCG
jgi:nitrogen fixation protein NifB